MVKSKKSVEKQNEEAPKEIIRNFEIKEPEEEKSEEEKNLEDLESAEEIEGYG